MDIYCLEPVEAAFTLANYPNTQNIREGQVEAWLQLYANDQTGKSFTFRNQSPAGESTDADCYYIEFNQANTLFCQRLLGVNSLIDSFTAPLTFDAWVHIRVRWWIFNGSLKVQLLTESAPGTWVDLGTLTDINNRWYASTVNKVGFGFIDIEGESEWSLLDDVSIYARQS